MFIPTILKAHPLEDYIIRLELADGVSGEADLSHLAGQGVFAYWNDYNNFRKAAVISGRYLAWSDEIDIDAASLYLIVTGKMPEEIFPGHSLGW